MTGLFTFLVLFLVAVPNAHAMTDFCDVLLSPAVSAENPSHDEIVNVYSELIQQVGFKYLTISELDAIVTSGDPFTLPQTQRTELVELQTTLKAIETALSNGAVLEATRPILIERLKSLLEMKSHDSDKQREQQQKQVHSSYGKLLFNLGDARRVSASVSPDGRWLIEIQPEPKEIILWDLHEGKKIDIAPSRYPQSMNPIATWVRFSKESSRFFIGYQGRALSIGTIDNGKLNITRANSWRVEDLDHETMDQSEIKFGVSDDEKRFVSLTFGDHYSVFESNQAPKFQTPAFPGSGDPPSRPHPTGVTISPDGKEVALVLGLEIFVTSFDDPTKLLYWYKGQSPWTPRIFYTPDGSSILACSTDYQGAFLLIKSQDGMFEKLPIPDLDNAFVLKVKFFNGGKSALVVTLKDLVYSLLLVDIKKRRVVQRLGHQRNDYWLDISISPDEKSATTVSQHGKVIFWHLDDFLIETNIGEAP